MWRNLEHSRDSLRYGWVRKGFRGGRKEVGGGVKVCVCG